MLAAAILFCHQSMQTNVVCTTLKISLVNVALGNQDKTDAFSTDRGGEKMDERELKAITCRDSRASRWKVRRPS
jgi:hypothetical protein